MLRRNLSTRKEKCFEIYFIKFYYLLLHTWCVITVTQRVSIYGLTFHSSHNRVFRRRLSRQSIEKHLSIMCLMKTRQLRANSYVTFGYLLSQICLSSVCHLTRLSVTFVHPTQPVEIFCNVSTPLYMLAVRWPLRKMLRRSSQGNLHRRLNAWGVAKYSDVIDKSKAISRKRPRIQLMTNWKSYQ